MKQSETAEIEVVLERAPDDPDVHAPEFQSELGAFYDQADRDELPLVAYGAEWHVHPEFVLTLVPAAIAGVAALCGAWVQARYGRKVRLKIGDMEAEGRSVEEIEALLQKAKQFKEAEQPNK
jgi:hypothetical protein